MPWPINFKGKYSVPPFGVCSGSELGLGSKTGRNKRYSKTKKRSWINFASQLWVGSFFSDFYSCCCLHTHRMILIARDTDDVYNAQRSPGIQMYAYRSFKTVLCLADKEKPSGLRKGGKEPDETSEAPPSPHVNQRRLDTIRFPRVVPSPDFHHNLIR